MIGCFDAKYHYLSWRPLHAILRADTDGNPHTMPDPTWQPLLPTPNHPEYPSAHACHTTAIAEALESFFGPGRLRFSIDSLVTGETRHYKRIQGGGRGSQQCSCVGGLPLSLFSGRMGRVLVGRSAGLWRGTSSSRSTERVLNNAINLRRAECSQPVMRTSASWADGAGQLGPFLVGFAAVRDGDAVTGRRIGNRRSDGGGQDGGPLQSRHRHRSRRGRMSASAQDASSQRQLIRFEVGDAQQLRFLNRKLRPDPLTFSCSISFPIPRRRWTNVRVTRAGGIVAAVVWDYGQGMEMLRCSGMRRWRSSPPSTPGRTAHAALPPREPAGVWREQGLQGVSEEALTVETRFSSFDDYWSPLLEKQGPAGAYVAAPSGQRARAAPAAVA